MGHIRLSVALLISVCISLFNTGLAAELETSKIELSTVQQLYHLDGLVEAIHQSTLSAQTTGQVEEVFFDVEDYVEKGQLILLINDSEQQSNLAKMQADLKRAKAELQDAQNEHDRTKGVFEKKLVATSVMDKAKAALNKARAGLDSSLAALEQARKQLEYTRVTAPYTGIVTKRHIEAGETAQPGMLLMSGISLDRLRVVVDVPQTLISAVRHEGKALVQKPDLSWVSAEKLTIFPFAEKNSNTFKVRLELPPNLKGLLPGMFVKVSFIAGNKKVLLVPREAVVYRSEVIGVYVVDQQDKVIFRHIRVGHAINADKLIVLSGLNKNERVALDPVAAGALLKLQRRHQNHG